MAQNGDTVAGKKVQLIVKDDTGVPDVTKRIAQELVVNDKVDRAGRLRPDAPGPGHGADRHPVQDAAGGDGRGDVQHHRSLAVHRAHQLHAAAGGCRHRRLGAQERHQDGRDAGHRLRPGHRRREVLQGPAAVQRRPGGGEPARAAAQPRLRAVPAEGARCQARCAVRVRAFGRGRGADEAVRRARPGQGRHQADRHRRRDRRRHPQRHGRRGAGRGDLAPLFGRAQLAGQQEVRRGLHQGQQATCGPTSWRWAATTACA